MKEEGVFEGYSLYFSFYSSYKKKKNIANIFFPQLQKGIVLRQKKLRDISFLDNSANS